MKKVNSIKNKIYSNRKLVIIAHKLSHLHFWTDWLFRLMLLVLFAGLIYVLLYPVLFVFSTSFKSITDMLDPTSIWVAKEPDFTTYSQAYKAMRYMEGFRNSAFIGLGAAIFQIASCSLIGYGFARFKFRERGLIFGLIVLTMVVPPQTIIIPQFLKYKSFDIFGIITAIRGTGLNMLDSYLPFMVPTAFGLGLKGGFFIYIFRQFFRGMPKELEEAAYIDGCGPFGTFTRIMMPNAIPAIVTVFLFSFVWHWNDVFEPTMFLQSGSKYPLSIRLLQIGGMIVKNAQVTDQIKIIPIKYAGVALAILPMFILYLFGQKYFVESVERSGIVG